MSSAESVPSCTSFNPASVDEPPPPPPDEFSPSALIKELLYNPELIFRQLFVESHSIYALPIFSFPCNAMTPSSSSKMYAEE